MKIEIRRWDNDEIIICGEYESVKDCLEKNRNKSFYGANLRSANLSSADLRSADLSSADLRSANLSSADLRWADLRSADLSSADLSSANLRWADLRSADLSWANLRWANLRLADLSSANLRWADLRLADLSWAKNINKYLTTPLYILLDQPNKIVAYKLVTKENIGPFNGGIVYEIGKEYEEKDFDTDENNQCGQGINLATLDWCIQEWKEGYKILLAEFKKKDIVCIPIGSDGKFRVKRCKIIGEKDLKEIGVSKQKEGIWIAGVN